MIIKNSHSLRCMDFMQNQILEGVCFINFFYLRPPKGCTDVFLFRVFMASFSEIKGRDRYLNARGFQSEKKYSLNKINTILAVCTARESDP